MKIKGHTIIKLTDAETGELIQKVEKDNLITGAVAKMLNFAMRHNFTACGSSDNYNSNGVKNWCSKKTNLYKGLMLFDTALTESADNYFAPSTAKLTGFAVYDVVNTSEQNNPGMGSFSDSYSEETATSLKMVWTFGKKAGNGTIACVCLTNLLGGYAGMGYENKASGREGLSNTDIIGVGTALPEGELGCVNTNPSSDQDLSRNIVQLNGGYVDFCLDSDTDYIYQFAVENLAFKVVKHKMTPSNFNIFAGAGAPEECVVVANKSGNFNNTYYRYFYNTDEKVLYFFGINSKKNRVYGSDNIYGITINKYDMANDTLTTSWKSVTFADATYTGSNQVDTIAITSSALYMCSSANSQGISKYSFSGSSWDSISFGENNRRLNNSPYIMKGLLFTNTGIGNNSTSPYTTRQAIINLSDDSVRYRYCFPENFGHVPPYDNTQLIFGAGKTVGQTSYAYTSLENSGTAAVNTFVPANYLATINNLSEAITKDETKNMEITYILTLSEEE